MQGLEASTRHDDGAMGVVELELGCVSRNLHIQKAAVGNEPTARAGVEDDAPGVRGGFRGIEILWYRIVSHTRREITCGSLVPGGAGLPA